MIVIAILLFFIIVVFLEWLAVVHPPYDWKAEARKIDAKFEAELEDYKRRIGL